MTGKILFSAFNVDMQTFVNKTKSKLHESLRLVVYYGFNETGLYQQEVGDVCISCAVFILSLRTTSGCMI